MCGVTPTSNHYFPHIRNILEPRLYNSLLRFVKLTPEC
jgi:hypothetical protein